MFVQKKREREREREIEREREKEKQRESKITKNKSENIIIFDNILQDNGKKIIVFIKKKTK